MTTVYRLTNPDKLLYPEDHYAKKDIAKYYEEVQSWILPYIIKRPLTIVRCPSGYQKCFYQKHIMEGSSNDLYGVMIKEKEGQGEYIYIKNFAGLFALVQQGTLELHPWGSKINHIEKPDIIIFDLDPAPDVAWKKIVETAFLIKNFLTEMKLKSFVKTTGGKGLHIVVPIKPKYEWEHIKRFTNKFAETIVSMHPNDYLSEMTKSKRVGKIFIDYMRNQRGATAIAPYSTRARIHAPVSMPLHWDELTHNIKDSSFTIKTAVKRLATLNKDPWDEFFSIKQNLTLKL